MDRIVRLQFIARVIYYLGWLATVLGTLSHFSVRLNLRLDALQLTQRNLMEASVMLFMISMASELRFIASKLRIPSTASSHTISSIQAKQAA
jgi:hypothetical protein